MPFDTPLVASTSWNIRRHVAIAPVLDEIRGLGFERIELGYVTAPFLPDLEPALAERGMAVQSIHNPCPWPADPDGDRHNGLEVDVLSSTDESIRRAMVDASRRTIDYAARLGAVAVVVHLGQVPQPVPQREVFALMVAGRSDRADRMLARARAEREALKRPYLDAALASIRELGEHAVGTGIRLGVETRDVYAEIATLDDMAEVMAATEGLPVGYWHDVGHVEKQRQLGIAAHEDWVRRFGHRIVGAHIHDTILERDHLAPGCGNTDFRAIAAALPPGTLRTLELGARPSFDEAREGIALLREVGLA